ncbi:MAG: GHKL domain-containing protein [Clostridiaceae bacterium]|nr:GHKL domain-containing protein [Clostridiaceae bacterium]
MENMKSVFNTMEFKVKVALIIIAIIPLSIYLILNHLVITKHFADVGQEKTIQKTERVVEVFRFKGESLLQFTKHLSSRENFHSFLNGGEYQTGDAERLQQFAINHNVALAAIVNEIGEIVHHYGIAEGDTPNLMKTSEIYDITNKIEAMYDREGTYGFLEYDGKLYIMAAAPLIRGSENIAHPGVMILARQVNEKFLAEIESLFQLTMVIDEKNHLIVGEINRELIEEINSKLENKSSIVHVPIMDIFNRKITSLMIIESRSAHLNTMKWAHINALRALIVSIIIMLLLSHYFKNSIMNPIRKISKDIKKMTKSNELNFIHAKGVMEIMDLADAFNNMVRNTEIHRKANEDLREKIEYDKLKNEFVANVSHELRTPLNVIFSSLQLLEATMSDEKDSKNIKKHLKIMKQNCYRLLRLANNLIDIKRVDAGLLQLNKENHNIVDVVEGIVLSVSKYIEDYNIELVFDTNVEEKVIACDSDKIERVILNLLSNAIKSTKSGDRIYVNIDDAYESIIISIRDTGIGIPMEKQKIIFESFRQAQELLTRKHEGSGIGLALVKSLVEMHGGIITVKSEPQKGSEFIVKLPAEVIEKNFINTKNKGLEHNKVEKINMEFSDIYSC